jgi:hypothetical protein
MSVDRESARDEISKLFTDAWAATSLALVYDDLAQAAPKASNTTDDQAPAFARLSIKHDNQDQVAFAADSSQKRYRATGTVWVQIFTPVATGLTQADSLVTLAKNAFRGHPTPGGVWFTNVRDREVGPTGAYFQNNVLATFTYDEFA